jgi:hypothetical protein
VVEEEVPAAGLEAALQEVCIHGDEVECGGRKEGGEKCFLLLPAWSLGRTAVVFLGVLGSGSLCVGCARPGYLPFWVCCPN